jgi:opacity protein-like surface antigen
MKKLFFIAALAATSFAVQAQDAAQPIKFSLGAEFALPVGDFINSGGGKLSDLYSFGIGGSVQGTYAASESLGLTLNVGFLSYLPKEVLGEKLPSFNVIPILAGFEYNLTPQVFASAQLGYSIYGGKFLSDDDATMGGFTYAPGIGYRFTENLSALLKYQGASVTAKQGGDKEKGNIGQIGLRVAYTF